MIRKRLRNVIVVGYGYKIKTKKRLVVITHEGEKKIFSPKDVEQLIISGSISITSDALRLLTENEVDVVFVKNYPMFFARIVRYDKKPATELWKIQALLSEERKMQISREIVDCLVYNKMRLLQHIEKNRDIDFSNEIKYLRNRRKMINESESRSSLMGLEGDASRVYFSTIRKVIPEEFGFTKRAKHPSHDPINSMLSYGYTILLSKVSHALMLSGLNAFEGIFHESYRERMALAYDLMEEFRQPIVDRVVLTLVARGAVNTLDFDVSNNLCKMKREFKRKYLDSLYSRFEERYKYRGEFTEFQDIILKQASELAKAIYYDRNYKGFRYR